MLAQTKNSKTTSPFLLRPYQDEIVKQVHADLKQGTRTLVIAGTGAGKTVIAAQLLQDFLIAKEKVLFLVHRDILVKQTAKKIKHLPYGIIAGRYRLDLSYSLQIGSLQTLTRKGLSWLDKHFALDVAIFDEAHLTNWFKFSLELFPLLPYQDQQKCIGLTATPWRTSKYQAMGDLYESSVLAPLPSELIQQGFLVPFVYFSIGKVDKKGLRLNKDGDYEKVSLKLLCNTPEAINHFVDEWLNKAKGRPTIVFSIDIEHAQAIAAAFNARGVKAASVDGTMKLSEREVIYDQLAQKEIEVVSSCEALSEGFDVPIVSCIGLLRLTRSRAKYIQQIGRGARITPDGLKRDCLVLDAVGLIEDFGYLETITAFDLELRTSDDQPESKTPPSVKTCPQCKRSLLSWLRVCSTCRHEFPSDYEILPPQPLKLVIPESSRPKYEHYQKMIREAYKKKTSFIEADNFFKSAYKHYPPASWRKGAIFGDNPSETERQNYLDYLKLLVNKYQIKDPEWIEKNCWEF